ncbi:hypothetical protein RIF29_38877 [Crotalaria pallida]|uniref:Uncharacterized protein n=1 Tax=Crotalaria pallida TaxID=3830 RepID=A0AAN9E0M3_CROPI
MEKWKDIEFDVEEDITLDIPDENLAKVDEGEKNTWLANSTNPEKEKQVDVNEVVLSMTKCQLNKDEEFLGIEKSVGPTDTESNKVNEDEIPDPDGNKLIKQLANENAETEKGQDLTKLTQGVENLGNSEIESLVIIKGATNSEQKKGLKTLARMQRNKKDQGVTPA